MAQKHKEAIIEILKKSGQLNTASLKERVCAKLHILDSDYPKSTYLNHLQALEDEMKISSKTEDNKKICFVKSFEHEVHGGLILENLEGRITVPVHLKASLPRIAQGIGQSKPSEFHFYFEFNSTNICLSVDKDALPFKIHISRKTDKAISDEVIKQYGSRTITLELPIAKISSHKGPEHSGHLLLEITEKGLVVISDLGATNPASVLKIQNLTPELFFRELSSTALKTVHSDWVEKTQAVLEKIPLTKNSKKENNVPAVIMLTSDSSLFVF